MFTTGSERPHHSSFDDDGEASFLDELFGFFDVGDGTLCAWNDGDTVLDGHSAGLDLITQAIDDATFSEKEDVSQLPLLKHHKRLRTLAEDR